jgi:hypothetical protein
MEKEEPKVNKSALLERIAIAGKNDLYVIAASHNTALFVRDIVRAFVKRAKELKYTPFDWLRILSAAKGDGSELEKLAERWSKGAEAESEPSAE